jgi:hypothetical protein
MGRVLVEHIREDETDFFPDPDAIMYQAFVDRIQKLLRAPFTLMVSEAKAIQRICRDLGGDLRSFLLSKTDYDLEYQYDNLLRRSA